MGHELHVSLGIVGNISFVRIGQRLHIVVDLPRVDVIGPRQHPGGLLASDLADGIRIMILSAHACWEGINPQVSRQSGRLFLRDHRLKSLIGRIRADILSKGQASDLQRIAGKLVPLDRFPVIFVGCILRQPQGQGALYVLLGLGRDGELAAVRGGSLGGFGQVCAGVGLLPLRHVNGYSVAALGELDFSCLVHGVRL